MKVINSRHEYYQGWSHSEPLGKAFQRLRHSFPRRPTICEKPALLIASLNGIYVVRTFPMVIGANLVGLVTARAWDVLRAIALPLLAFRWLKSGLWNTKICRLVRRRGLGLCLIGHTRRRTHSRLWPRRRLATCTPLVLSTFRMAYP